MKKLKTDVSDMMFWNELMILANLFCHLNKLNRKFSSNNKVCLQEMPTVDLIILRQECGIHSKA